MLDNTKAMENVELSLFTAVLLRIQKRKGKKEFSTYEIQQEIIEKTRYRGWIITDVPTHSPEPPSKPFLIIAMKRVGRIIKELCELSAVKGLEKSEQKDEGGFNKWIYRPDVDSATNQEEKNSPSKKLNRKHIADYLSSRPNGATVRQIQSRFKGLNRNRSGEILDLAVGLFIVEKNNKAPSKSLVRLNESYVESRFLKKLTSAKIPVD